MALYDWNKNGKKYVADDFIEYQIYKDCLKSSTGNISFSSSRSGTWLIAFFIFMFVLTLLGVR